ncbi:HET-domain-containing protein [Hypoxylon sp. EC38]|nr:HET-domain-containing protein [Hypoxylon sp. EC38]
MSRILQEKRSYEVEVARWCPEKPYVELLVPEDVRAVSEVVFRTDSHDQGYSGEAKGQGTYEFSYTWFVAIAISPGGIERSPRQVVQYNVHASRVFKRHEVIWNTNSEVPSIRDWVRSIRGGDTIRLTPKAQWAGWINFVREAEIEVRCSNISKVSTETPRSYRRLDKSSEEIRLLSLNPGAPDDPVSCSLIYARLGEHPPVKYESLSYCWGNASDKGEITMNVLEDGAELTYTMPVTLSLLGALKAIRPLTGPARVLWVDAICINQDDFDERSSQVAMMRSIYRQAQKVVVWLGEGDDNSQRSIRLINAISDRYKEFGSWVGSDKDNLKSLHDPLLDDRDGAHSFIDNFHLFTFPWFRRTWVAQEIFNARDSVFCCGSDTVEWESLLRVNKCIPLRGVTMKSVTRALMPPFFDKLFSSKITEEKGTIFTNLEILDVLVQGFELDATDPRDKLYSLNEWRTWQETRWGASSSNRIPEELPSWSWGYRGHSNWAIGILGLSRDNPYRASGDTLPDIQGVEQSVEFPLILPLSGFRIGVIKEIKTYPYFQPPGAGCEDLHSAYVANFDPLNLTGKWNYQLNSRVDEKYIGVKPSDIAYESKGHSRAHAHSHTVSGGLKCHSKCFFSTHEGSVGLCPYSARPGDLVVILYGGNVTYILRSRTQHGGESDEPKRFEFVGECFTQGYMNGEGIQEREKKGIPTEVFTLY